MALNPLINRKEYKMDVQTLQSLIGNLGFPIVACCVMMWYVQENNKQHEKTVEMLRKSLDDNTKAITELKMSINNINR